MWRGRGIRFPRRLGWRSGRLTDAEAAWRGCAQGERPIGSMDTIRLVADPAKVWSPGCRVTHTDLEPRNLLLSERAMPHSVLARGPPLPCSKAPFFKWI